MQKIINDPTILNKLKINPNSVRSIEEDAQSILNLYEVMLNQ